MIDAFDRLLTSRCSIWKKGGSGIFDNYGHESQEFTLLKEDIPCRVEQGEGKELESEAAFGIQKYTIFMRPQFVDNPPIALTIHHWLQINKTTGIDGVEVSLVDPPNAEGQQLINIRNIKNPSMLNHHIEITGDLIEP